MTFRLIIVVVFILFEPFLPVKAFFWSDISYQFLLWILLLGLFDWSARDAREKFVLAGIICAVFFRPSVCGLTFPWSNSFYLILLSAIFFVSFLGTRDIVWRKTSLDIPIISFLILATSYMCLSLDKMAGLRQVISLWGAGILYFILVREIKGVVLARNLVLVFLMAALRIMANGLYQFWKGFKETRFWIETYTQGELGSRLLTRLNSGRVFSNFVYPNAYAGFLIMVIPVICFLLWQVKGRRSGIGLLLGLSFFSLYLTYSKGGWLSLALTALIAFVFLFPKLGAGHKLFILLLSLILIFGMVSLLESTGSTKLGFTESFKARWEYWQASLHMIRDNPFRGYGLGNFGEIYAGYKLPMAEETRMAHNNYLQVWVEMGLAGFLVLLWIVFNFIRLGLSSSISENPLDMRALSRGVFWGGVAFFIHSLVDFDFYVPNLIFSAFFLIGVLAALKGKSYEYIVLKNSRLKLLCLVLGGVIFLWLLRTQTGYINYLFTLERVNELVAERDFDRAKEEIEKLLEDDRFNAGLYFEKGRLSEIKAFKEKNKSDFADAIYGYTMASGLNPYRAGYHFRLGNLYWYLRDEPVFLKKALSEFRLACEAYPTKKEYRLFLEAVQQYSGNEK